MFLGKTISAKGGLEGDRVLLLRRSVDRSGQGGRQKREGTFFTYGEAVGYREDIFSFFFFFFFFLFFFFFFLLLLFLLCHFTI